MTKKTIGVKICGLVEPKTLNTAIDSGARFVGFNFVPQSPRCLSPLGFGALATIAHGRCARVAVIADADDDLLDAIHKNGSVEFWQLHGKETPERCADIRKRYKIPVIKALNAGTRATIENWKHYPSADGFLFDAPLPENTSPGQTILHGGHGQSANWSLFPQAELPAFWLLAGGLKAANVAEAVAKSGALYVDCASGVETTRGQKSTTLIRQFINAAHTLPLSSSTNGGDNGRFLLPF